MDDVLSFFSQGLQAIQPPAYPGDCGFDLAISEPCSIPARGISAINLDLFIAIPDKHVGMICDRSGMARRGMKVLGGIIDSQYRGRVAVIMANLTDRPCIFEPGDRIAQLLIMPIETPPLVRVAEETDLGHTERGGNGFGSTGLQVTA